MVDVSIKARSARRAVARGFVRMRQAVISAIADRIVPKGDVLSCARIAGIMAAKRTGDIIPLCHPLALDHCEVRFEVNDKGIAVSAEVKTYGPTGVEMEALTAVTVAALTIYDMCKAMDKSIEITDILLLEKEGGRSGKYQYAPKGGG